MQQERYFGRGPESPWGEGERRAIHTSSSVTRPPEGHSAAEGARSPPEVAEQVPVLATLSGLENKEARRRQLLAIWLWREHKAEAVFPP
ncbi:hypothetical protein AAFF_G00095630 [Aldrovandia affinis]|uniref:Uncharacterized protein n=1 Tax=Aldrovandia affinis TaxID=143900 RepID=A0AAD7RVK2_9TELE|nr:hypothetical protein AAFF_G00095630 [Aldrovandia affinis]